MEDYLYHYGVKGMKWGRRKQRLKDKIASRKAKKERLRKWKTLKNDILNEEVNFEEEYDTTSEGSSRFKKLKRSHDNLDDTDSTSVNQYYTDQESYLRGMREYSAKKLIDKFGNEKMSKYVYGYDNEVVRDRRDIIKSMSDEWYIHAD